MSSCTNKLPEFQKSQIRIPIFWLSRHMNFKKKIGIKNGIKILLTMGVPEIRTINRNSQLSLQGYLCNGLPRLYICVDHSGLCPLARLMRVKNLIYWSHTSSSNQHTYEGPSTQTLGGYTSKGRKDEGETQRPWVQSMSDTDNFHFILWSMHKDADWPCRKTWKTWNIIQEHY